MQTTMMRWLLVALLSTAPGLATAAIVAEGSVDLDNGQAIVGGVGGPDSDGSLTITPPDAPEYQQLLVAGTGENGVAGEVLIDGAGITVLSESLLGLNGFGVLTIQSGGRFSQRNGQFRLGSGGIGRLEVHGEGSEAILGEGFDGPQIYVGSSGGSRGGSAALSRGEIEVSQGGELFTNTSFDALYLGLNGSASVVVTGVGSTWRSSGEVLVGNADVAIRDGGRLIHTPQNGSQQNLVLGAVGGSTSMSVSGEGSSISVLDSNGFNNAGILIGESGHAVVRVDAGADVTTVGTAIGGGVSFRDEGPRRGVLELDGFGTTWTTNSLYLGGVQGRAELWITNGAALNQLNTQENGVFVGRDIESSALVVIDGAASRWIATNDQLHLGEQGRGELHITGGAYHENGRVTLGVNQGVGLAVVSGEGSTWKIREDLDVWNGGITIADGGVVQLPFDTYLAGGSHLTLDDGEVRSRFGNSFIQNQGRISGDGLIDAQVQNSGELRVGPGQTLQVDELANSSYIEVVGGELSSGAAIVNSGRVDLFDATLRGGSPFGQPPTFVNNPGADTRFMGGESRVYGGFHQRGGGFVVTGDSTTRFYGPVYGAGDVYVTEGSTVFFHDDFTSGAVLGDGRAVYDGALFLRTAFGVVTDVDTDLTVTAEMEVVLDGSGTPALATSGVVDLGGELLLSSSAALPTGPQSLPLIEASEVVDTFDSLPAPDTHLGHRVLYRGVEYTPTSVLVLVEQLAAGDYNGDGVVDQADYDTWAAAYGTVGDSLADGNLDGVVDAADYTIWNDAYDSLNAQQAVVPEPASGLAVVSVLLLTAARRKK